MQKHLQQYFDEIIMFEHAFFFIKNSASLT